MATVSGVLHVTISVPGWLSLHESTAGLTKCLAGPCTPEADEGESSGKESIGALYLSLSAEYTVGMLHMTFLVVKL